MPIYNRLSVRASVRVFVALAVFNAALLGLLGFWQSLQNRAVTEALHTDVDLVRAAGHADMMHDALRATVYRALHGSSHASAEERKAIEAEAAEFRQEFAKAVATFDRLAGEAGLADALQRAKPLIERYQQAAAGIVGAAFDDPARA